VVCSIILIMIWPFLKKLLFGILMSASAHSAPLVLILLGPPGSGKGTQASLLHDKLHIPHIATGDLLRDHIRRGTELGEQAKTFIDKGLLVPDAVIIDMLFERVSQKDCAKGYILDGFPRTLPQAEAFRTRLKGQPAPIVINLEIAPLPTTWCTPRQKRRENAISAAASSLTGPMTMKR
jgi:adenylate kinase